jgi:glutamate-ammonia-ligase adenylyltransferase
VSALAARFDEVLAGTPLDARASPGSARFAERRGGDAAAKRLSTPALRGLARLVATQPEVASFLSNRPAWFERVADLAPHSLEERGAELAACGAELSAMDLESALDALRLRRREETALAACAHLGGIAPFAAVSQYLSLLAESTACAALDLARRQVHGAPESGDPFAVIGMGKIAGREFTYHSDLDLIFLFGGGTAIDRASRLGQRLIAYLATMTGAGIAYAVDTRLRPSGQQGMLVASFEGYERYQTREAATWEHLAMLRARPIAGAVPAADERLRAVRARVLPHPEPPWRELADLRQRVIDERARGDDGAAAFKTGAGGLMDVDFVAGGGILERGAQPYPELPSVAAMLAAVGGSGFGAALLADYHWLREVEACARWVAGRPVERLPSELDAVAELALPGLDPEALREQVVAARQRIRAAYDRVVARGSIAALEAV